MWKLRPARPKRLAWRASEVASSLLRWMAMTDRDRARLDEIIDAHDRAGEALRRSRAAYIDAVASVRVTLDQLAVAIHAQDDGMDQIRAATHAALVWLRSLE